MLAKKHRLTKRKDFDDIFKKGRSAFNDITGVKVFSNNLEISKYGFIVSGKISKKATERNLIKRRMREAVRQELPRLKNGINCAILAQKEAKQANYSEIGRSIRQNFARLKLYR
jgi:ribonuclease P protein component